MQPPMQPLQPADHAMVLETASAGLQDAAAYVQSDWLSLPLDVKGLITAYRLLRSNNIHRRLIVVCMQRLQVSRNAQEVAKR